MKMILRESLTQRTHVSRVSLSREPKSMIWCESLTQRVNTSRVSFKTRGRKYVKYV